MKKLIISIMVVFVLLLGVFHADVSADYYSDNTLLYKGMQNTEVKNLQNDLKSINYFGTFTPTGYFGYNTEQAVMKFQRDNNLVADGIVGRATAREIKVDKVLKTAKSYQGVPYVWGGVSPSGFDCSGYTHYVMLQNGITIPRTSDLQYNVGVPVDRSQLKAGDLVFFTTYKPGPSHVGFYLGDGKFIHESSGAGMVIISELSNPYYSSHYIGAKRVI